MIQVIRAKDRHFTDLSWLQTYWLFSFSSYYDPDNINHGALRVFNDDIVQPHTGFPTHPHEEMEIVSVILDGEMVHRDSMGNEMVVKKNDVQRMSAGTGLQHSEWNDGDVPVKFFQIWIEPDTRGLQPTYDQRNFEPDFWKNRLALVASNTPGKDTVSLNTDGSIYRAELDSGGHIEYQTAKHRHVFVYTIRGAVTINSHTADERSQCRINGEKTLTVQARSAAEIILIDVP